MGIEQEAREFQETIIRSVGQHVAPYVVRLNGVDYVMFPNTFNPSYAKASLFLLDNLGVENGDTILDPFTGSGVDAIFAALMGASKVVAIDRFTMPYLCTRYNVHVLGLEDKVDVRQGNLFDPLEPGEKFDLVIANPPFKRMKATSDIEAAVRDEDYITLKGFFSGVGNHMTTKGRMRVVFSDVGDMSFFHDQAEKNGFQSETIATTNYASSVRIEVYEMRKRKGCPS